MLVSEGDEDREVGELAMKIIIAGGGTAGHINPGIAIAKYIMNRYPNARIMFVGTQRGLEKELVPREGFEIKFIKARGFSRKISFDIFLTAKDMISGYIEARKIIKSFNPEIVIGTGGYVCLPLVMAASRLKVPTLIHEANSLPGIANKILGKFVDAVAISFKETEKYFKGNRKVVFTGNPVRTEILSTTREDARKHEQIEQSTLMVLAFGGSRGAQKLNEAIVDIIISNDGKLPYRLVFSTGQNQFDLVKNRLEKSGLTFGQCKNVRIVPYIFDIAKFMAAADLFVGRAGAITISEITAIGLSSILIPFPYATENHQECNARTLEKQGAAIVVLEKDLTGEILNQQITSLVNNKELIAKMSKNAKKMGVLDAVEKIGEVIEELREK